MKISKSKLKKLIESFLLETEDENVKTPKVEPDASFTEALKALDQVAKGINSEKAAETLIKIPKQIVDFLKLEPNDDSKDVKLTKAEADKILKDNFRKIKIKSDREKEK